jgi:hypothetical protein
MAIMRQFGSLNDRTGCDIVPKVERVGSLWQKSLFTASDQQQNGLAGK